MACKNRGMLMQRAAVALGLCLGLTTDPSAFGMSQQVIAYTDMPVNIPGENLRIDRLAPNNSIGFHASPVINAVGDIAFWSRLEEAAGNPSFGDAIWSYKNGAMTPVAYAGQTIPGTTAGTYDSFMGRRVILDNAGNLAFGSQVDLAAGGTVKGIFVKAANGTLRKTVLEGDTVPQVDPLSPAFGYVFDSIGSGISFLAPYSGDDYVFNGNNTGFSSRIADPNGPSSFGPALYVERPGFSPTGLDLIARSGSDTSFIPASAVYAISPTSEAMFRTNVKANDDDPSFNAIATYNQADISYIAMSGSGAGGDISFGSFGSTPGFNITGQAAFSAKFSDLADSDSGLFKSQDPNGIIATEGIVANGTPDTNGDGTPDLVFNDFSSVNPLLNANGKTVFIHTARTNDNSIRRTGMWSDRTGTLTSLDPVVFVGDQAPGLAEGMLFTTVARNGISQSVGFNAHNDIVFIGQARDGTGPITTGLWAEIDGVLTLIVATGEIVNLPDGSTLTVRNIDFMGGSGNQDGRPSGLSDNGQITYRVDDGARGAYLLFSPVTILPGDTDGDGDVDDADLGTAFANFTGPIGILGGKNLTQGDTDGDGDVDDADLGSAFSNFTGPIGPAHVPEPATGGALISASLLALWRRPRQTM